jgi:hypothetical protein
MKRVNSVEVKSPPTATSRSAKTTPMTEKRHAGDARSACRRELKAV